MPYLSHILNTKVSDSADEVVGRLKDVLVKVGFGQYSPLSHLVVMPKKGKDLIYIPYSYVENFSKEEISLKTLFSKIPIEQTPPEHCAFLNRDVLDQQIVDVGGSRVVRVNDLKVGDSDGRTCVLGIDISVKGLLRRLGLAQLDFLNLFKVNLIDWRKAQPVRGVLHLDSMSKELAKLHPADLANIVEDLSIKNGSRLVASLDAESAAKVLEEVDPKLQKILVNQFTPEQIKNILTKMSIDEIVDLLKDLPVEEEGIVMSQLQNGKMKKIKQLLKYHNDTAGGLMTPDYISMRPENTVADAIEEIKKYSENLRSILYIYVTDADNKFIGAVSLRWLILSQDKNKTISNFVKRIPHKSLLKCDYTVEQVVNIMTKYDLNMAAVVDEKNKMMGVVTIDDVMRHLVPKA